MHKAKGTSEDEDQGEPKTETRKGHKDKKKKTDDGKDGKQQKGQKMRTALDVIKRIQWDETLTPELITIGYVDRFIGVVEDPFEKFSHWCDLASVGEDDDVLAIPQHRIQYFKYRDTKVWDKPSRTDLIFGSTYPADHHHDLEEILTKIDVAYRQRCFDRINEGVQDSDDSDSGDELDIEIGPLVSNEFMANINDDRSTHFIAVQINTPEIKEKAAHIQQGVVDFDEYLVDCTMRPGLYHMTLSMLRIEDGEGVREAIDMMRDIEADLKSLDLEESVSLKVGQLGTFGQRVLYAKVSPEPVDAFTLVKSTIDSQLSRCTDKVQANNKFGFVPHMTLVKVSRPVARARHSKYIPSKYYEQHSQDQLGCQPFDNLQLCVIDSETRPSDGFYQTLYEIKF